MYPARRTEPTVAHHGRQNPWRDRLKVVGESSSRFLPLLVAFLMTSVKIHWLKKTFSPCNSSQRLSK